jgi:hypothetical protein
MPESRACFLAEAGLFWVIWFFCAAEPFLLDEACHLHFNDREFEE